MYLQILESDSLNHSVQQGIHFIRMSKRHWLFWENIKTHALARISEGMERPRQGNIDMMRHLATANLWFDMLNIYRQMLFLFENE